MNRRHFLGTTGAAALGATLLSLMPRDGSAGSASSAPARPDARPAPALDESRLRELFEGAVKRSGAYGAQLSIIKGDQQLDFAAGFAHALRRVDMTTDTLIQIGSITKVFNATIVVSLVQEGALDLDTPVKRYLPDFAIADAEATRTLTLRRLLSMSSGLDNGPYVYFGGGDDALGRYVANLKSLPQNFRPGSHFGYSNAGTCIAGHMASRITGKPWETLLRERILEPAGLTQSAALDEDAARQRVSVGHDTSPGSSQPKIIEPDFTAHRSRAPSGATLALSTSHLARFGRIFLNKGMADTGARILPAASVELMMSPQTQVPTRKYASSWCIGPYAGNWNGVCYWGHAGGTPTSASFLHWIPEQNGVIAFIVNTRPALGEFSRSTFDEILYAAFGFRRPRFDVPEGAVGPLDYSRYVGTYEELGGTMEVARGEGNTLQGRIVTRFQTRVLATSEQPIVLTPLGGDRFLVSPSDGADKYLGVTDTVFFGKDSQGRATNVLNAAIFPMHRTG